MWIHIVIATKVDSVKLQVTVDSAGYSSDYMYMYSVGMNVGFRFVLTNGTAANTLTIV